MQTLTHTPTESSKFLGFADSLIGLNPKKLSTITKFISVVTDKQSADASSFFVEHLEHCIQHLPSQSSNLNKIDLQGKLETTKENLLEINKCLHFVDEVFNIAPDCPTEIMIDDDNALTLLGNTQKAKHKLELIYDHLSLVLHVLSVKENLSEAPTYTISDLLNKVQVQAA